MDPGIIDDAVRLPGDAGIVQEAVERFKACKDWQDTQDQRTREDIKFANADSRNSWQWPTKIYQERTAGGNELPCLTINNVRVHNDLIINQMSKNGFGIKVRPTGGKASYQSAQVMQSIIRRIQYISKGTSQRRKVSEQQVDGGIGYMLIETAYTSERSFDQDIYMKASRDPTAVYLDPWIREPDGSDADFGFVFERMPRKEFNRKYPEFKNKVGAAPVDSSFVEWISDKEIMLCKYFRKKEKKDTLYAYKTDAGDEVEKLGSEIKEDSGKELLDALKQDIKDGKVDGRTRKITNNEVEWFLIAGDTIIDEGEWAGKYIPICRCVGREVVIDATLDRKGHTRPLIDAQRMLNFSASTDVQVTALAPKSPWLAPARAVEGQEQWKSANINAFGVLFYNDLDEEASTPEIQKIPPPQRIDSPKGNQAYQLAMQNAERQMMMISGQWQSETGQPSGNEPESGRAIQARKEQGDVATYHFAEHMNDMDRFIGVQLLDLIPKIYDTERALQIEDDNGDRHWISINPNQAEAVQELQDVKEQEEAIKLAFNPKVGEYECISDPGPDFATARQEAWETYSLLMQNNKELAAVASDLLFKFSDAPGADKISERLAKEIKAMKPYLFDDKAEPQLMALQQQAQRLTSLNAELMTKLADANLKIRGRDEKRNIESFNADTKRMEAEIKALASVMLTPQQKAEFEHQLTQMAQQHVYDSIQQANQAALEPAGEEGEGQKPQKAANGFDPTMIGARKAKDGKHYLPDPSRPGKYLQVQ